MVEIAFSSSQKISVHPLVHELLVNNAILSQYVQRINPMNQTEIVENF